MENLENSNPTGTVAEEAVSERGPKQDAGPPDRRRWVASIRSVKIATARYSNRNIVSSGLTPVRITRYHPRFKLPYKPVSFAPLAPEAWMLEIAKEVHGERRFREAFDAHLGKLDEGMIAEKLVELAQGKGVVLLCFEDIRKPRTYCHRQQVAAWLDATYGIVVEELQE
jgi:hypothetical protein